MFLGGKANTTGGPVAASCAVALRLRRNLKTALSTIAETAGLSELKVWFLAAAAQARKAAALTSLKVCWSPVEQSTSFTAYFNKRLSSFFNLRRFAAGCRDPSESQPLDEDAFKGLFAGALELDDAS